MRSPHLLNEGLLSCPCRVGSRAVVAAAVVAVAGTATGAGAEVEIGTAVE